MAIRKSNMTYRELLHDLQQLSEDELDLEVIVYDRQVDLSFPARGLEFQSKADGGHPFIFFDGCDVALLGEPT